MLRIYDVVIEAIGEMRPVISQIERRDADLARQMRRAFSSVALNLAEGAGVRGGLRKARYETALGSMREVMACIDVARAFGYVCEVDAVTVAKMNRVVGALVKLVCR